MAYFDAGNTAHLALIVTPLRSHPDLATVAASAEFDVIGQYTRKLPMPPVDPAYTLSQGYDKGNGTWVALAGFNPTVASVTDADLVTALRYTIADVLAWRLSLTDFNPGVQSFSTAIGISKSLRTDANRKFPPGHWGYRLDAWDIRPAVVCT